jgi:hypothetical protein
MFARCQSVATALFGCARGRLPAAGAFSSPAGARLPSCSGGEGCAPTSSRATARPRAGVFGRFACGGERIGTPGPARCFRQLAFLPIWLGARIPPTAATTVLSAARPRSRATVCGARITSTTSSSRSTTTPARVSRGGGVPYSFTSRGRIVLRRPVAWRWRFPICGASWLVSARKPESLSVCRGDPRGRPYHQGHPREVPLRSMRVLPSRPENRGAHPNMCGAELNGQGKIRAHPH